MWIRISPIVVALSLMAGCAPDPGPQLQYDYASGNFARAERQLKPLAKKTDENYVLNNETPSSKCLLMTKASPVRQRLSEKQWWGLALSPSERLTP